MYIIFIYTVYTSSSWSYNFCRYSNMHLREFCPSLGIVCATYCSTRILPLTLEYLRPRWIWSPRNWTWNLVCCLTETKTFVDKSSCEISRWNELWAATFATKFLGAQGVVWSLVSALVHRHPICGGKWHVFGVFRRAEFFWDVSQHHLRDLLPLHAFQMLSCRTFLMLRWLVQKQELKTYMVLKWMKPFPTCRPITWHRNMASMYPAWRD